MAKTNPLHWLPFPVDRWLGELAGGLRPEQKGALMDLLATAWQQTPPCSLPNDETYLAGRSGLGAKWKTHRAAILAHFAPTDDGRLVCQWLLDIYNEQHTKYTNRSTANRNNRRGTKGATNRDTDGAQSIELEGGLEAPLTGQLLASPDAGDALAPEGAALPAATGGDYQATPSAQAALAKLGHRPDPDAPRSPVPTLRELDAQREQQLERDRVHYAEVIESARAWKKDHPEQMPAIRREQRARLDLDETEDVPPSKRRSLTEGILGAISFANQWPGPDVWDGSPMYRSPAEATA